jgi:esterase/lipase superfamily enzyme
MHREYHRWHSPSLGRDMELLIFGHAGARVLIFPSSMGRFFEWEDRGMIHGALGHHIAQGWLQVCCVDSIDGESWYAKWRHPHDRAARHAQYDAYVRDEVLPLLGSINPTPFLITTGVSFGAYHAMTFALRYPDRVGRVVGLSGLYDVREITGGYSDETVYFYNPADFVVGESDPGRLAALQRLDIIMAIGRDDPMRGNNDYFSARLWSKGIGNALRIWDGWYHDWPYWQQMLPMYIGGHD